MGLLLVRLADDLHGHARCQGVLPQVVHAQRRGGRGLFGVAEGVVDHGGLDDLANERERLQQEMDDPFRLALLDDDPRPFLLGRQSDGNVIVLLMQPQDPSRLDSAHGFGVVEQDDIRPVLAQFQHCLGTVATIPYLVPLLAQLGADQSSDLLVLLNNEDLCGHRGEMTGKEAAIEVKIGTWENRHLAGRAL